MFPRKASFVSFILFAGILSVSIAHADPEGGDPADPAEHGQERRSEARPAEAAHLPAPPATQAARPAPAPAVQIAHPVEMRPVAAPVVQPVRSVQVQLPPARVEPRAEPARPIAAPVVRAPEVRQELPRQDQPRAGLGVGAPRSMPGAEHARETEPARQIRVVENREEAPKAGPAFHVAPAREMPLQQVDREARPERDVRQDREVREQRDARQDREVHEQRDARQDREVREQREVRRDDKLPLYRDQGVVERERGPQYREQQELRPEHHRDMIAGRPVNTERVIRDQHERDAFYDRYERREREHEHEQVEHMREIRRPDFHFRAIERREVVIERRHYYNRSHGWGIIIGFRGSEAQFRCDDGTEYYVPYTSIEDNSYITMGSRVHNLYNGIGTVIGIDPMNPNNVRVKRDKGGVYDTTMDQLYLGHGDFEPNYSMNGFRIHDRVWNESLGGGRLNEIFDDGYVNVRWDEDHRQWPIAMSDLAVTCDASENSCVAELNRLLSPATQEQQAKSADELRKKDGLASPTEDAKLEKPLSPAATDSGQGL